MKNLDLKAGSLIVFSEGEYSDYGYIGAFVVLQDVTDAQMRDIEARLTTKADEDACGHCEIGQFVTACIREGWLAEINLREIHLGNYDRLDLY